MISLEGNGTITFTESQHPVSKHEKLKTFHLFAGAGGGLLADLILGHEPVCAVEWDAYCCQILRERAAEGWFPGLQVFEGDVRLFNGRQWAGKIDVVAGGFPCTDISIAGKGAGIEGKESGLWKEMFRIICEIRPNFAFVENSPMLTSRGLGRIIGDLAEAGFDAEWGCFSACEVGAPHIRERMFILAHTVGERRVGVGENKQTGRSKFDLSIFKTWGHIQDHLRIPMATFFDNPMRGVVRNDDGLAVGMDRLKAVGNGQCAQQAAHAWRELYGRLMVDNV